VWRLTTKDAFQRLRPSSARLPSIQFHHRKSTHLRTPPCAVHARNPQALSEFKRTHEADSLAALRGMMREGDWEVLQQVTSPASYFT